MRRSNRRGGAAVVAVLIVIMLVAVGSAVMVVTGRNSIQASKTVEAPPPPGYDDVSSSEAESSSVPDSSSFVEIPETKPSVLPQIADTYKTIDLEDMTANSAVLINADTNEIIAGYKYDKEIYPASLTKLLTLLVAAENIEDMDATYKFTSDDIDPLIEENASRAGFEADEEVPMKDLLYASILVSGADGTLGLAKGVAGSEENFVELMNLKITELGLSSTHFVNASGLHDEDHYSTVQDIAAITKACLDNDICREVLEASSYTTSKTEQHEDGIELTSIFHSRYGGYWIDTDGDGEGDADVLGGKTGFTDEALFTLSSIIEYEGTEYICVTAKSKDELVSVEDTIAILENYLPGAAGTDSGSDDSDSSKSDDTSAE
ncbi:MAG: serine hydrolase [Ruminococcus sp.]|nr:serine hydrolase [Ruminococcus sp.]